MSSVILDLCLWIGMVNNSFIIKGAFINNCNKKMEKITNRSLSVTYQLFL